MGEVNVPPDLITAIVSLEQRVAELERRTARAAGASGTFTLTWPGGSPESDLATATYDLPSAPKVVAVPVSRVGAVPFIVWTDTPSTTEFSLRGRTVDGTSPAGAATATVHWIVQV